MIINRKKNTIRGVVFGYISKIITVLFPFAIRTIIIYSLGRDYIGLNSLFTSILTILNLADLGFGTAMVFSMYKPIAEDDTETMNALLNLYRRIYRVVGLIVLVAGLLIMPAIPYLIKGNYPADINLYTLYAVYLINNVIGYFFFAYKTSLLSAHQRSDISSKINIIVQTIMYVCQIVVLLLFKNYYVYIIFLPLSTLGINLYTAHVTKKMFPQYFCKGALGKELKSDIKKKITALITHKIGYVIQASIDNICLSAFVGLAFLSVYNNYYYVISAIQGFISIIKQSMVAGIGNSIIVETSEYNRKQFYKHLLFFDWLAAWCTCCFLCLFQPFIKAWIGQENLLAFSMVICLCIMFFIGEIRGAIGLYKDALGMWWEDRFKPIAISLVNLAGTVISAYFGFYEGVVISTAVGYGLVGLPWETHVFFKYYMKEKPTKYYAKQIFYCLVCLASATLTYFICSLVPLEGIRLIVVRFIICLFVPNVIMFIIYYLTSQLDRKKFNMVMKKFIRKIGASLAKIYVALLRIVPIKKNRIYFISNDGKRFSCNPRAFFEYLYKNHRDEFEFYYCLNSKDKSILPKDVKSAKYKSIRDLYYLNTSKYIVNNTRFHYVFKKRKGQIYIQTWHGTTMQFKAIEAAVESSLDPKYVISAKNDGKYIDIVPLGSKYLLDYYKKYFWNDNGIYTVEGSPRYDKIIGASKDEIKTIRKKLNLPATKKVVLIAPTFKNNKSLEYDLLDNEKLVKIFKENLDEDVVVAYRFHPNVANQAKELNFENAVDLTFAEDSQEVVLASDYIITDFSSIIFDGLLANKKCICFSKDFDDYIKNDRSLWIDIKDFPMPILKSEQALYEFLENSKSFDWKKMNEDVISKYEICEDGHASEHLYKNMKNYSSSSSNHS